VVLKGGHRRGQPLDILVSAEGTWVFTGNRVRGSQARGTGCRFAAAIAASLARGMSLPQAVRLAKSYLLRVIRQGSRRA
jgi:hydroxymethylpyrimidine/phosphomethylpyrimidine kinase